MPDFLRRQRVLIAFGVVVVLGACAAVAAYVIVTHRPGNVSHPDVPFEAPTTATAPPAPPKRRPQRPRTVSWPRYGYTQTHTRAFQPDHALNGPWRRVWVHRAGALTEFPPVIWKGQTFQLIDNGRLVSLTARTGKVRWKRRLGALAASSPAVDAQRVFVVLLVGRRGSNAGRVVALRRTTGRILWSRTLSGRAESSPLLRDGKVYFGSENGTVYCLNARNGHVRWTYHAAGAVKGSPTYDAGKLYFGDYGGYVQAIRASDGKLLWKSGAAKGLVRAGTFYATAAVAFGRVYIGSTDGREYSFSSRTGSLAWAHQTGGYVYSSAAVDNVHGGGPTVFVGSYDGHFYALDARTGNVRWTYDAKGKISGSPTIIGQTVYFANLAARETIGLSTRSGRVVFKRTPGAFDPIVSDGQWLYLTGSSSLTALRQVPERSAATGAKGAAGRRQAARAKARAQAKAKARARKRHR